MKRYQEDIAFIDVKNEPDQDDVIYGQRNVDRWLRSMLQLLHNRLPNVPLTIGWSSTASALRLSDAVDFLSFHHYSGLQALATDPIMTYFNKPLICEEFGMSTHCLMRLSERKKEWQQAAYILSYLDYFHRKHLSFFIWTMYDFSKVPNDVAGSAGRKKNIQRHFGLFRSPGHPKPIGHILMDGSTPPPTETGIHR